MDPLWVKRGRRLGRLLYCECFGFYGEGEIGGLLTIMKARIKQLIFFFFIIVRFCGLGRLMIGCNSEFLR